MRFASDCFLIAIVIIASLLALVEGNLNVITREDNTGTGPNVLPSNGAAVDEVIVESSLYIKPKRQDNARKVRSIITSKLFDNSLVEHKRVKRFEAIVKAHPLK